MVSQRSILTLGVAGLPKVRSGELHELDSIVEHEIPVLRRAASKASAFVDLEEVVDEESSKAFAEAIAGSKKSKQTSA